MENNALELASQLKAIIDTAIDGIITINEVGVVETLNYAAANIFGFDQAEVIGHNIKMLMPEPYHSEHDGYLHRYHATKKPHIIGIGREVKGKRKNGDIFPFRLAVSEVILNDRVIYTGIIHDLSAVKEAQEELARMNKSLEKMVSQRTYELKDVVNKLLSTNKSLEVQVSERQLTEEKLRKSELDLKEALVKEKELGELKSRFVTMASHEFRTPLSSILSSASLIGRYPHEHQQENRDKHINRIKDAVANLTGILNDFLSLAKLEEGRIQVNKEHLKLASLCEDIVDQTKGLLKPGQQMIHALHGSAKVVSVDKTILRNIMFNLISNAIKYSDKNIHCDITFRIDDFEIKIRDQGIGIPIEEQKHMFTRFFRASNVTNIQGTGLGLNIVKNYVQLLNGSISFESEHEIGTTFVISLPYH